MVDVMDGALDLSKPTGDDSKTTSPAPSLSPEPPSHRAGDTERSESVSSDGHDTDGSTTTRTQAIAGPFAAGSVMPTVIAPPSQSDSQGVTTEGEMGSNPLPSGEAGGPRPFKMYPFEAMPGMYSQLAAAANATAAGAGLNQAGVGALGAGVGAGLMNPFAAAVGSPLPFGGLLDSAITLSSPIGQYLAQRKRRAEAASNKQGGGVNTNGPKSPATKNNGTSNGMSNGTNAEEAALLQQQQQLQQGVKVEDFSSSLSPHIDNISANSPASVGIPSRQNGNSNNSPTPEAKRLKLSSDGETKDESYWERRRKNNEAAKRSRDSRRAKEEEIALRAAFLEQENLKLRAQVAILKNETAKLHYMLYQRV